MFVKSKTLYRTTVRVVLSLKISVLVARVRFPGGAIVSDIVALFNECKDNCSSKYRNALIYALSVNRYLFLFIERKINVMFVKSNTLLRSTDCVAVSFKSRVQFPHGAIVVFRKSR